MFKRHVRAITTALSLGLVGATPLHAQEVARTFDQLSVLLAPGQKVKIADSSGHEFTATVERLSSSSLTVWADGHRRELQAADIVTLRQRRPDSLWNGAIIGFVGGLACPAMTIGMDYDGDIRAFILINSIAGLAGSGVGIGIDALIRSWRVTYATPTSATPSAVTVAPLVAPGRKGVMVAWRF